MWFTCKGTMSIWARCLELLCFTSKFTIWVFWFNKIYDKMNRNVYKCLLFIYKQRKEWKSSDKCRYIIIIWYTGAGKALIIYNWRINSYVKRALNPCPGGRNGINSMKFDSSPWPNRIKIYTSHAIVFITSADSLYTYVYNTTICLKHIVQDEID